MTIWQLLRAAVDVPAEALVQDNKWSDRISVPFLFFFQQASVQMRCFCVCFTAAGEGESLLHDKRDGVLGRPLSRPACRRVEPGVPQGRWDAALARWVLACSRSVWVIHQGRKNLHCTTSVMRWSRISQAFKDVLMLCWKPVMIRFGFFLRLWNNRAVGVCLELSALELGLYKE